METVFTLTRHSRVSRLFILGSALAMLAGLLISAPPSIAHAVASTVTINTIGTKTTPYRGQSTIAPSYSVSGQVQVDKAAVTVAAGAKVVANRASSVRLSPGTYTLTQEVTYRTYSYQTRQQEIIAAGSWLSPYGTSDDIYPTQCAITSAPTTGDNTGTWTATCHLAQLNVGVLEGTVDTEGTWAFDGIIFVLSNSENEEVDMIPSQLNVDHLFGPTGKILATTALTKSVTEKVYQPSVTATKVETLTIKAGARDCATFADYKKVKATKKIKKGNSVKVVAHKLFSAGVRYSYERRGRYLLEIRVYKACTAGKAMAVGFVNGHAYAKSYA
jgi:hypothetical protein